VLLASFCLGGARAAASDPLLEPSNVGWWADGATVQLRGAIAAEPEPRVDYRLLTVQVSAISFNRGQSWETASGRISVTDYAPETWYTAAYGDTIVATGALKSPGTGYVPPGITGSIERARLRVLAHGGNPVLAWLYALRVLLAESRQHALPEPEASLLVGIAFGLKTPLLRSRLALFTTTGTIHLVVPAGLKVSVLATLARRVAQPLGRYGGTALSLGVVAGYAFLGGGGPAAPPSWAPAW
jgi:competence protein ComEC